MLKHTARLALALLVLGAAPPTVANVPPVVVLPARLDGYMMAVEGKLESETVWLDLDSGGIHSVIDASVAKQLQLPVSGALDVTGAAAGAVKAARLAPVEVELQTLSFRLGDPLALDLSQVGSVIGARGLIGFELFQRYVVAYDYDRKTVSLYEPKTYVYRGSGSRVPLVIRPPRAFVWVTVAAPGVAPERHLLRIDTGSSDSVDDDIVLRSSEPKKTITGGVGIGASRFQTYLAPLSSLQIGPYTLHSDLLSATGGRSADREPGVAPLQHRVRFLPKLHVSHAARSVGRVAMRARRSVTIRGVVQGVFFRETVRRVASRYDVHGFVRNVGCDALEIEAEGEPRVVNAFIAEVLAHPPAAARIEDVRSTSMEPQGGVGFAVAPSSR